MLQFDYNFYSKIQHYSWKRPSKLSVLTPSFYRHEHVVSERWSPQLVSDRVGSRTQLPNLVQSFLPSPTFFSLLQTKQELVKQFRRPNTGLACGINVHLSHGICYLQLCSCYGICCSVFSLCTWFAILGQSNMLPQSTEQWSVNLICLTLWSVS